MSLSTRTRFEVFKRDRFTCSYCGRTPPTVLLEADHIVPVAGGGSDDLANLTTACQDCNRGKSDRLLEEGTAPIPHGPSAEEMQERIDQAKAYMETLGAYQAVTEEMIGRVIDTWAATFGARRVEREDGTYWELDSHFPERNSIRRFLRDLSLDDLLYAVEAAAARIPNPYRDEACRYFYGVCHRTIREGRLRR